MAVSREQMREVLIKKSRRDLLVTLKMVYPGALDYRSIRLVTPDVDDHYLEIDLAYLVDKGYVRRENAQPNQRRDDREWKLTALGVETADRINRDPAIEA